MPRKPTSKNTLSKDEMINKLSVVIAELNLIAAHVQNEADPKVTGPLIDTVATHLAELVDSLGGHNVGSDDTVVGSS